MDWTVCFICQESTHDRPRSTPEGPSRNMFNCTLEADQRAVRHARDAISQVYEFALVQTIDTYVLVLLISFAGTFGGEPISV